ncbi:MAG: endolytic transglycosylase MltG [Alistipes sp.]|nr:endolytic transglycosylase MltG [Candidatus Minthomonas equi]
MTRKTITIISCTAGIIILAAAVFFLYYYITFKKPNVIQETELFIDRSYTYERLIDTLRSREFLTKWKSFERASKKIGLNHFKKGHYIFKPGMNNSQIINTLTFGWETPIKFSFRGYTKTVPRLCGVFAKAFEADSTEFAEAFLDSETIDSLGFKKETYIGMFIPDTYEMYWTSSPEKILLRMKLEYDKFWDEKRCLAAEKMHFDKNQVMTLASIVTGETNHVPEMATIAGVYMNRLHKGMLLQACPTVIFAHLDKEPNIRRVLKRHLSIDSPYNTYKYPGLPPGPICVPTKSAIEAVLHYEKTNYLFFAAKPEFNGTHNFASTYSEHIKNGKAYTKAYLKREREKKNNR